MKCEMKHFILEKNLNNKSSYNLKLRYFAIFLHKHQYYILYIQCYVIKNINIFLRINIIYCTLSIFKFSLFIFNYDMGFFKFF